MANKIETKSKSTEKTVLNSAKSDNTVNETVKEQSNNKEKSNEPIVDAEKTEEKSADRKETKAKEEPKKAGICVVTYIGSGIWSDNNGDKWSRESIDGTMIFSERKYDKGEYEERADLKFMVSYGEMKLTEV